MSSAERPRVLDASVGVKWFKPESGSEEALALLSAAIDRGIRLVAPDHFAAEVLAVVRRHYSPADVLAAWDHLDAAGVAIVRTSRELVAEASSQCEALDCSFYDALAPALASLLDAELVSADARAHGAYPGVRLIG